MSSILEWFGEDLGATQAAQLRKIAPYLPSREAYDVALGNDVSVSYLDYDWGLNDARCMLDTAVGGTRFTGTAFFDFIVTWIEFAPWFLCLLVAWQYHHQSAPEKS